MATVSSVERLAYTIKEACQTGLFSRSRLYELIAAGAIKAHKSGYRTVILTEEMERYRRGLPLAEIGQGRVAA